MSKVEKVEKASIFTAISSGESVATFSLIYLHNKSESQKVLHNLLIPLLLLLPAREAAAPEPSWKPAF